MDLWQSCLCICAVLASLWDQVGSISCYQCHSSQPGCGLSLNIRLQRRHGCPSMRSGAGENFCVKVLDKRGSEESYTRECLSTLMHHTGHREKMPTVRRHGYCEPARNNDPWEPVDESAIYCFCNDYNGCNTAPNVKSSRTVVAIHGLVLAAFTRWLL